MKEELILQNPWWENKNKIFQDDKILLAEKAKPPIKYNFIEGNNILLGPRQVGKTTYLKLYIKHLLELKKHEKDLIYFSCEPLNSKKDLIELFREINELSLSEKKKYLFLDEVTSVENWEQAVKYLLEQKIIPDFQVICTGSNACLLKKGSERFPGRDIGIQLFLPLTFSEYVRNLTGIRFSPLNGFTLHEIYLNCKKLYPFLNQINRELRIYLKTGGLPKPLYEYHEKGLISSETYEIYTKWILGSLAQLNKSESIFRSLIKGIVKSYLSRISLNSLAKDFQIPAHSTVETYLEVLSRLLLINLLYQADLNTKTPLFKKNKKIYFQDPFFYNVFKGYITGAYKDFSEGEEDKIIEGVICQELASLLRKGPEISDFLWYYDSKKETDFVLKQKEKLVGLEVKWQPKVKEADFNNRFVFKEKILLSKNVLSYNKKRNLYILPLSLFLLSLTPNSKIYL